MPDGLALVVGGLAEGGADAGIAAGVDSVGTAAVADGAAGAAAGGLAGGAAAGVDATGAAGTFLGGGLGVGADGLAADLGAAGIAGDAFSGDAIAAASAGGAGLGNVSGAALAGDGQGVTPAYSGPGTAGAGATGEGAQPFSLSSLFDKNSTLASLFSKGGQGVGIAQVLSSLYGLQQSKQLQKQSAQPGMTAAGLQAVQRSMGAQGYQGSGNMMAALEQYGAQTNVPNIQGTTAALTGQLSSLGLLTSGLPKLAGWGDSSGASTAATIGS